MDEQAYLEPGFDPGSLTMPRLRSILVAHNVNYPSSAKKSQLVEIFNDTVLPQARSIRTANARVKRTSRGIEDVPKSQGTTESDEEEEERRPPPPASTRSSRRTTRARTDELPDVAPTPRSGRHSTAPPQDTPRRASSKHARPADVQEEPETARRMSKKVRPSATVLKDDEGEGGSPFSAENVFQSGSSPPPPVPRSRDTERRRTTTTTNRDVERRRSHDRRRQSENVRPVKGQTDGAVVPSRKTFEMPAARMKQQEEVEPTEEFTPDEHQELINIEQRGALVPTSRRNKRPSSSTVKLAPLAIITALLGGLGTVWRQEKIDVGYCGVGRPTMELAGTPIPGWADFMRPQCEPCPPHAYCGEKLETVCEQDFVLTSHPLSLGGAIPLPPSCEPDSEKARKVSMVKERAVEQLRERNAQYECGEATKAEVKETELKKLISASKRKSMSNEEFEDLWAAAIPEIQGADEVVSGTDGSHFTLRSTSLARLPLACAVRRSLRETLRQYLWQLIAGIILLSGGGYGRHRITSGRETEGKAKQLASQALERLSQQAALHAWDPEAYAENYVSVAQLRDDVLRDEFSAGRRKALWEKVQRKVEGNSNVRPMVREGRSGNVGRVWEWVGAVGLIEGASAPSTVDRRKSGNRVSFGGVTQERLIEPREESEMSMQKWEEGGKYY
ncbi:inner nuclear membrane protein enriched at telomere/subtelomere region [Friedmanniomyces endolithicus]|uniref:Inner nuclear membrane protein enriched at telomere/subtelomere region n=1 Tax=Friedmanniomyces endolithicus TaxID=329885 RepID=A0AAN6K8P1_9PEZI|nr:inner nuclear membrane protein enriched at telomere/subtelomere region [Friedmanniomyces endolithicus]KAK0967060.1 inner nuclear membrane protein enriched at telomere/subtelomere region [Friedmanniomyces endolithicus]KAK0970156.1 inner nuclear membrane protein enriched at telomere/subtelomere region [Friedmanniomyces endolithicus]KAK1044416.1 inner nuclear membrane protein enriched at telomere/subtelomere region [Friedmanniomyces endolithicus]